MAYPFAKAPTVGEFIAAVVANHSATLRRTSEEVVGPRGAVSFRYLEREDEEGGRPWRTVPLPEDDEAVLGPGPVRSYCAQLRISPKEFGFILD